MKEDTPPKEPPPIPAEETTATKESRVALWMARGAGTFAGLLTFVWLAAGEILLLVALFIGVLVGAMVTTGIRVWTRQSVEQRFESFIKLIAGTAGLFFFILLGNLLIEYLKRR